jgi:hypothetical protein
VRLLGATDKAGDDTDQAQDRDSRAMATFSVPFNQRGRWRTT